MTYALRRHSTLEAVSVEVRTTVDGQGMPAYAAAVEVQARVLRVTEVERMASGQEVRTVAMLLIDAEQSTHPTFDDRITTADGLVGIVVYREDEKTIQSGELSHIIVKMREE